MSDETDLRQLLAQAAQLVIEVHTLNVRALDGQMPTEILSAIAQLSGDLYRLQTKIYSLLYPS